MRLARLAAVGLAIGLIAGFAIALLRTRPGAPSSSTIDTSRNGIRALDGDGSRMRDDGGTRALDGDGSRMRDGGGTRTRDGDGTRMRDDGGTRTRDGDGTRTPDREGTRTAAGGLPRDARSASPAVPVKVLELGTHRRVGG